MNNVPVAKVLFFLPLFFLFSGLSTPALETAVSAGPEWNMSSPENFAAGFGLGFDINLPGVPLAVGINVAGSANFSKTGVIETAPFIRWYFMNTPYTGFFAQLDTGYFHILESGDSIPRFTGGVRGGYRLPLGKMFYIEPYGRFGYPYFFGIGVMAVIGLNLSKDSTVQVQE